MRLWRSDAGNSPLSSTPEPESPPWMGYVGAKLICSSISNEPQQKPPSSGGGTTSMTLTAASRPEVMRRERSAITSCRSRTTGPSTRTMVSRHSSGLRALPSHLSPTAIPPVYPTAPSITSNE
mgnify:CR=1 FL=1